MTKTKKGLVFILLILSVVQFASISNKSHAAELNKINAGIIKNVEKVIDINEK